MNILAPVNTLKSALSVMDAGAEEIYLGGDERLYNSFSFTGRGKSHDNKRQINGSFDELKEIVGLAHEREVKVNFLGNLSFFNNGDYRGKKLETYYVNYMEKGLSLGVDSLVIGDLGLLKCICDKNYPVKIHASVFFNTMNKYQMYFLKDIGVSRVTLNYQVSVKELGILCKENILDIEVIGYMGCSFYNGMCSFLHEYGESCDEEYSPGVTCKGIYQEHAEGGGKLQRIFDVETICCLCSLKELEEIGVKVVKIAGREQDSKIISLVVALYKKKLRNQDNDIEVPPWWKRQYCKLNRCKFRINENENYSIGDYYDL